MDRNIRWLGSFSPGRRCPHPDPKDVQMFLLTSLNLLPDGQRNDDSRSLSGGDGKSDFPQGQLSSAAWEGWWQDDVV
jgi:hypothetical protein